MGIRLRPLTKSEKDRNLAIRWIVRENSVISLDPTIRKQEENTFHFGMFTIGKHFDVDFYCLVILSHEIITYLSLSCDVYSWKT